MIPDRHMWEAAASTKFAAKCKERMAYNGLLYHNWDHILRCLYHAGHTFNLPFDPTLADCILCHDVVYNASGDNEKQSALWMLDNREPTNDVIDLTEMILKTIEHRPSADNRMILIDLANFMDPVESAETRERVIRENMELRGLSYAAVLEGNTDFLRKLRVRLGNMDGVPSEDIPHFMKIRAGIETFIT